MPTPRALHSSESNEWYTPPAIVDAARDVMGGIDLDPATCAQAQAWIQADQFYTERGLEQPWKGRLFVNPPYGRTGNKRRWSQHLIAAHDSGSVTAAVLVVTAAMNDLWFNPLLAYPICFPKGRVKFISASPSKQSPGHSTAVVYLGKDEQAFVDRFQVFGPVVRRI